MTGSRDDALYSLLASQAPVERLALLNAVCHGDPALRHRLEARLAALDFAPTVLAGHSSASGLHSSPEPGAADGAHVSSPSGSSDGLLMEGPGSRIGRYKLLQQIGEGGCGTVFMAEQEEPVRRRVALKIIKLGMDTKAVVARFEAERQALAMMDHPNIAKVFDAGATASGRPFFVMELVRGIPITRHCEDFALNTRERLSLFVLVCQAIQHAHQKGIIHRDIKPSNILVSQPDGPGSTGVPKVIDFGIAKAQEGGLTNKTLFTAFEQFIGTPAYMSPEQAALGGSDVDTRSDIYSLGVLLYELLTGQTPFDARELAKSGLEGIRRTIQEEEPVRPSTRLSQTRGLLETAADGSTGTTPEERRRHAQREHWVRERIAQLRGDLDWVVMKCLEKDRARRYETANDLAADLRLYLDHEPVSARPPSTWYQLQKTFRRHRLMVLAGAMVMTALAVGAGFSSWQAAMATRARDEELRANDRLRLQITKTETALDQARSAAAGELRQRLRSERLLHSMLQSKAESLFQVPQAPLAMELLAKVLRADPSNQVAATRLVAALGRPFTQPLTPPLIHENWVSDAAFSADGLRLVTMSWDGTARIWDARTGQPLTGPLRHEREIRYAGFSPDGSRLVTASSDRTARLWDAHTGRPISPPLPHEGKVRFALFSPDGRRLVTVSDHSAQSWDASTGDRLGPAFQTTDALDAGRFTSEGLLLAGNLPQGARIWNVDRNEAVTRVLPCEAKVWFAVFSPEGRRVAVSTLDGRARVWDVRTGEAVGEPIRHGGLIRFLNFSPDGLRLATASEDGTARVWRVRTGQPLTAPLRHAGKVRSIEFSGDGTRLITASDDKSARVWDSWTGQALSEPFTHDQTVNLARFSPDGLWAVTVSDDNSARVWNARPGLILAEPLRHTGELRSARFSADGRRVITASEDGTAQMWETATGGRIGPPLRHDGEVLFAEFSPNGDRIATAAATATARIWDSARGEPVGEVMRHEGRVSSVLFSADGLRVVTASGDGTARVWDAHTGVPVTPPLQHGRTVMSAYFSPDSKKVITSSLDRTARLWDAETGSPLGEVLLHDQPLVDAQFSPDGLQIVTASRDKSARVWDIKSGRLMAGPFPHENLLRTVQFSPDGRWILTATDGPSANLWDLALGKPLTDPLVLPGRIRTVQFSPDGHRIVAGSNAGQARVWDAETGLPMSELLSHRGEITSACFSSDGRWALTGAYDHSAQIWDVAPASVPVPSWFLDWAGAWVGRRLDEAGNGQALPLEQIRQLRDQVAARTGDDFFVRFAHWTQGNPSTRHISPNSTLTVPEYVDHRVREDMVPSLREAVRLNPTSSLAWLRLAQLEMAQESTSDPDRAAAALFSVSQALRLDPSNGQALKLKDELQRHPEIAFP